MKCKVWYVYIEVVLFGEKKYVSINVGDEEEKKKKERDLSKNGKLWKEESMELIFSFPALDC
jgi:hypothetical protein